MNMLTNLTAFNLHRSNWSAFLKILLCTALFVSSACNREQEQAPQARVLQLRIVHPPEVTSYFSSVVEGINSKGIILPDGTSVQFDLRQANSNIAADEIARGVLKTHAWLVPSTSLAHYVNANLKNLGPEQINCRQLFASPVVFAVASRQAQMLGVNNNEITFSELVGSEFATTKITKHSFSIAHTSPIESVSGMASLIQLAYFTNQKEGSLTQQDLEDPVNFEMLRAFEGLIAGYGFHENAMLSSLVRSRSDKIPLAITTEQQVALFNRRMGKSSPEVRALYPTDGSYWLDYTLCSSDADWVTPAHHAAIKLFSEVLSGRAAQESILRKGFRPSVVKLPPVAPLSAEYGVDPSKGSKAFLPISGDAYSYLLKKWPDLMRPKALILVLDTSGSMEGAALRVGKNQIRNLMAANSWKDLLALVTFGTQVTLTSDLTADNRAVIPLLDQLKARGGSSVYDAIKKALDLSKRKELEQFRKIVIIYTDGEDKNSEISLKSLLAIMEDSVKFQNISLVIVGAGIDADFSDLRLIAEAGNGLFKQGGLDDMDKIFQEVLASL